ncbi:Alpha/Beta hydrolase protein [Haematococcus lacustris]
MRGAAAAGHGCLALDLPGHGGSTGQAELSIEAAADLVASLLPQALKASAAPVGPRSGAGEGGGVATGSAAPPPPVVVVAYSLGARLALALALRHPRLVAGLLLLSATPGIKDPGQAARRAAVDQRLAQRLQEQGLPAFLDSWYAGSLWSSLRRHPSFPGLVLRRCQEGDPHQLAAALRGMSTGQMAPMWTQLPQLQAPVLLLAGELDTKFTTIGRHMIKVARSPPSPTHPSLARTPAPAPGLAPSPTPAPSPAPGLAPPPAAAPGLLATSAAIAPTSHSGTAASTGSDTGHSSNRSSSSGGSGSSSSSGSSGSSSSRSRSGGGSMQLAVVPDAGHALHIEQPLVVLQQLLAFVSLVDGGAASRPDR